VCKDKKSFTGCEGNNGQCMCGNVNYCSYPKCPTSSETTSNGICGCSYNKGTDINKLPPNLPLPFSNIDDEEIFTEVNKSGSLSTYNGIGVLLFMGMILIAGLAYLKHHPVGATYDSLPQTSSRVEIPDSPFPMSYQSDF